MSEASKVLEAHAWPGNVRELRNVLNRASILAGSDTISEETLRRCIDPKPVGIGANNGGRARRGRKYCRIIL